MFDILNEYVVIVINRRHEPGRAQFFIACAFDSDCSDELFSITTIFLLVVVCRLRRCFGVSVSCVVLVILLSIT